MTLAVNIFILVVLIMSYVIYNLYTKNVKLEDALLKREAVFIAISDLIKTSEKKLKDVDRLGAFASDDEVGFFFETVKGIQEQLNDFKI
jgi:hypothetical protein